MATAKRKASAKRTVKYAAKTQANAASTTARAAQSAARTGGQWVNSQTADWQKGANEWAKQSAKMYQLPFAQGEAGDVAKKAAATVQSATENMMKMGSDMMQQMFAQGKKAGASNEGFNPANMFKQAPNMFAQMPKMNNFDAASAQEKMSGFARESAEQMAKTAGNANRAMNEAMSLSRENTQAAMEVSNIAVTVSKELGAEIVGFMNKIFSQNVELSKQVLSCRTLNDMFDLSSRLIKTNLDGFFSESVKMSEIIFQCANDVSEPLNERVSETAKRLTKALAA